MLIPCGGAIKSIAGETNVPPLGIVVDSICDWIFLESRQKFGQLMSMSQ